MTTLLFIGLIIYFAYAIHKWTDRVSDSLNPYNYDSKTKFAGLRDDYRLIKTNPQKWLWGADNTGDITRVNNIKSFKKPNVIDLEFKTYEAAEEVATVLKAEIIDTNIAKVA